MHTRRRLRLRHFDYSTDGPYLVTVCTHGRTRFIGRIEDDMVILSRLGKIVDAQLRGLRDRFAGVELDMYVVMPNHIHAIVGLSTRARQASPLRLGHIVAAFKSGSAREINSLRRTPGAPVWQRGYHDHVVRDEADLERVREYVDNNPIRWALDPENTS